MGWLLHDKTHVWAPAWEGWLALAGLVFFAWPCPSLCHFWNLPARPPPDPVHALVSWHVAGLFALASRPCERHILFMLREGSSQSGAMCRGVGGRGDNPRGGAAGWAAERAPRMCMCVVMCELVYLNAWPSCLVKGKYAPLVTAFEEWHAQAGSLRVYRPSYTSRIVAACAGFIYSHWWNPTKAHANRRASAHLSCPTSSVVLWWGIKIIDLSNNANRFFKVKKFNECINVWQWWIVFCALTKGLQSWSVFNC